MPDAALQYPIGKFHWSGANTAQDRLRYIEEIERTPARLRAAVAGLDAAQFGTPYREGGWSVRQVAHHLADSHINAYVRMKLALTENEPTIKPYDEARWAELPDSREAPVEASLALMDSLHQRWVSVLRGMTAADFARNFNHPEHGLRSLDWLLALYAWHGQHHVAHITGLRQRKGW